MLFFLCIILVNAQSCAPYSLNFPTAAVCLNRFTYPIFVPAGRTQNEAYQPILEALFSDFRLTGGLVVPTTSAVSDLCQTAVVALICGVFVPGDDGALCENYCADCCF